MTNEAFRQKNETGEIDFTLTGIGGTGPTAGHISIQKDLSGGSVAPTPYSIAGDLAVKLKSGAAGPTTGLTYKVYLVRGGRADGVEVVDDLGAVAAAVATLPDNIEPIGDVVIKTTANKVYYKTFRVTNFSRFSSILIWNSSDAAMATSDEDHSVNLVPISDVIV